MREFIIQTDKGFLFLIKHHKRMMSKKAEVKMVKLSGSKNDFDSGELTVTQFERVRNETRTERSLQLRLKDLKPGNLVVYYRRDSVLDDTGVILKIYELIAQ